MLGIDMSVGLLIAGILVLCATTAVSVLPWRVPALRRGPTTPARRPVAPIQANYRRVVTGQPASAGHLALPAGRPNASSTDGLPYDVTDADAAEALIDRLLENDPELLAALMTQWIREDDPDAPPAEPARDTRARSSGVATGGWETN